MGAIGGALDTSFYYCFYVQAGTDVAQVVVLAFEDVGGAAAGYSDAIEMGDGGCDFVGQAVAEGVVEGRGRLDCRRGGLRSRRLELVFANARGKIRLRPILRRLLRLSTGSLAGFAWGRGACCLVRFHSGL